MACDFGGSWMRRWSAWCCVGLLWMQVGVAALPEAKSDEELLFARRVIEFWKDKENALTQSQIETFLCTYPTSAFRDHFQAILGDIALEERHYPQALIAYAAIRDIEIIKKVRVKRWHALYQLQDYATLYQELLPKLSFIDEEEGLFYFAEAALRHTLAQQELDAETRQMRLREILAIYQKIQSNDHFGGHAQLAMAEIYRHLGEVEQAAQLYLTIAQDQKSPQTLYHAATLLALCDEPKAIELFARLAKGGGTKAADAAYQWLQLLAKHKDWTVLQKERRCFLTTLHEEHLASYHFYLGMLAYEAKQFVDALEPLQKSLTSGLKPPYDKHALLALLATSRECKQTEPADVAYKLIQERYPDELETAALMHALCYRAAERLPQALQLLSELIAAGKTPVILENAYLEKTLILTQLREWDQAHDLTAQFIKQFPLSAHRNQIMRLAVDLSLATENYAQLAHDLEQALDTRHVYTIEEQFSNKLLLAKCYFTLDRELSTLVLLRSLLEEGWESAQLHYLLALSYMKQEDALDQALFHGEQAFALDPQLAEGERLHLYLFNAYLNKSQKTANSALAQQAAAHLYAIVDTFPVSLENQLWLAHTYAKQPHTHMQARHIFENILTGERSQLSKFQEETFLLASLYQEEGEHVRALALLEPLHELEPRPKVQLLLATVYKALGRMQEALVLFTAAEMAEDPYIAMTAQGETARFTLASPHSRQEGLIALDKLKHIWVNKDLLHEPMHLEAALDYADFKATLTPQESQLKVLLAIKEHFTCESDIYSKDYHEARRTHLDKDRIYQTYMRLLETKIYLAEANESKLSSKEVESKKKAAHALMITLTQSKHAVTPYIHDQLEKLQTTTRWVR